MFFQNYRPAIISLLSSIIHQVINGIILGQQIGKDGLAAVGLYGPVVIVLVALSLPIMIGGGVLIGKSIGAGDFEKVQKVFQFATALVVLIGGCVTVSAPFIAAPLSRFLAGAANVALADKTAEYAFWQLLGLPFFFLGMIWGNFVRANGAPKVSRNASILAAGINVVLYRDIDRLVSVRPTHCIIFRGSKYGLPIVLFRQKVLNYLSIMPKRECRATLDLANPITLIPTEPPVQPVRL